MSKQNQEKERPAKLCFFTTVLDKDKKRLIILEDNIDNDNNKKNRRNCGCHEVTYNTDNRDYHFYCGCPPLSVLSVSSVGQPVRLYKAKRS